MQAKQNSPEDEAWQQRMRREHPGCFACDPGPTQEASPHGALGLVCRKLADGSVEGTLEPKAWMHGYPDRMHGGLVATLLDSAMTQCLFAHDIRAVTATLYIRYRQPVTLNQPLMLKARIVQKDRKVYDLAASLHVEGRCCATAEARFMKIESSV